MRTESIAFFDVDHTVCRGATILGFVLVCMKRGYIRWWYLLGAPMIYIMYRLFSLKMEFLFSMSLPKLKGIPRSEFEDIAREAFENNIRKKVYLDALAEIHSLQNAGVRVLLATAAPFEVVYPLALYCGLNADDILATRFSYTDGLFDGRLSGDPLFSKYKRGIIKSYVERSGTDMQSCSFYSDSIHDYPLMEIVGHPVAVNPDYRLYIAAKVKGWNIRRYRK
jgi:HAD superfamily hydrolase (TIGR01490 family)